MQFLTFLTFALSAAEHVLHEKRSTAGYGPWLKLERVPSDAIVPLRIGLKQSNLDLGPDRLLAVSHPESELYGKYLSAEEVHDLFSPSQDTVDAVRDWLVESGLNETLIAHSDNKGWFAASVTAGAVERLFKSELYEFEHGDSGHIRIGCDEYHVPEHLSGHIDMVTPGVKMSATLKKTKRNVPRWGHGGPGHGGGGWGHGGHGGHRGPGRIPGDPWDHGGHHMPPGAHGLPPELQNCAQNITPPCWRALYGLPKAHINDSVNDVGLFEQGDYFAQEDISKYFATFAPNVPPSTAPKVVSVDGGEAPVAPDDLSNTGESDLDIDIVTSLLYPQGVVVYQVDDANYAAQEVARNNLFNTFLDAVDGSYCSYSAYGITGNSSPDPTYPDPAPGGYTGPLQCGVYKATRVISISYVAMEHELPKRYVQRQCNEFLKFGLQGHTVLAGSGDYGVAFPAAVGDDYCLGQDHTAYNPTHPSVCPWVTSVGGTRLYPNQTIRDRESAMEFPEIANFSTGGGFSNYFPAPSYQRRARAEYFSRHDPGYPYYIANDDASNEGENGGIYNRAGRGYPDIAANGGRMPAYTNGTLYRYVGTSLATPVFASVVTLINQQRTIAGKGPVGFLNPVMYENPWMFNDIVNGSNPGCGSEGFHAVQGWDPVTGLGTPNYPRMLRVFLGMR